MSETKKGFRSIEEVPLPFRRIFSDYPCFNLVQSEVLNDVLRSDTSLVVSSPTGSGKTVIFELAIIKLLMQFENLTDVNLFKIIYISPIKSLCQERLLDWHNKFSPFGLKVVAVTGDSDNMDFESLANHNLILSTPEKWDSLTRRWRGNERIVEVVKLFMIDEVHLLNEENRGSTLEVIVSRMKTIEDSLCSNQRRQKIRFLALSATIQNVRDIADWIGKPPNVTFFRFAEDVRPVKLKKIVLGYNYNPKTMTPFKFDLTLNYKLQFLMMQHSDGKPTLIFCSTRKSVEMTAKHLIQTLQIQLNPAQTQKLYDVANTITDVKARETIKHGVGYHHAGMSPETRHAIEGVFRRSELPVLVATSTLAMGVNLPAHLVIIKSTKCYDNCGFRDYTEIAIHQMMGRAGRPQFDTSATVLILTTNEDKKKFENMVDCNQPIESNLHRHLTEHLNAEVVLRTITDLYVAMQWLTSTFLYVRARKNPNHYGLSATLNKEQIDKKLLEICQIDLNKLRSAGMITMDHNVNITPTKTGEIMAKYYVAFETMKLFTQISGTEILTQILALVSKCHEFSELRLRVNDKKTLNLLNKNSKKDTIRFPLNGRIKTADMKVNCTIQAVLGNLDISDQSILGDSFTIMRNGQRIVKCLIDYLGTRGKNCYSALLNSIILGKCFHAKLWENSPFVSKQLTGIGSVLSTLLVNAGKTSFAKIAESNPRDIELIVKKRLPMGDNLIEEVQHIPTYTMTLEKLAESKSIQLRLTIQLKNLDYLQEKSTIHLKSAMSLLVGNNLNEILIYERYQHSYMMENPLLTKVFEVEVVTDLEKIEAHFISEDWVGIDCYSDILIDNNIQKTDQSSKKLTSGQATKQPSYIQMFFFFFLKIKKKPTEGDQPIKGKKVEKKKNSKEEKGEQLGKENKVSEKQKNKKGGKTDNDQLKGGGSTTEVRKVEDTDQGTINKIVQKVSKENIGFHFMCNNRDIIENSFEIEDDNEEGSVTNDDALMNEQDITETDFVAVKSEYNNTNDKNSDYELNKIGEIDVDEFFNHDMSENLSANQILENNNICIQKSIVKENSETNETKTETIRINKKAQLEQPELTIRSETNEEKDQPLFSISQKYLSDGNSQQENVNVNCFRMINQSSDTNKQLKDMDCNSLNSQSGSLHSNQLEDKMNNEATKKNMIEEVCVTEAENQSDTNHPIFDPQQIACEKDKSKPEKTENLGKVTEEDNVLKLSIDFDYFLNNDPSLYHITQKYRNLDSGEKNGSAGEKSYKFLNGNPRLNLSNKNTCLTNIHYGFLKSKKKKQKLDIEEIHPAEQLEDNLFVEEKKKTIIDCFKKPEKKKIRHNSENNNCPDSTMDNPMFHITEFLEPPRKKKVYDFEDTVNDRMERDNPKSIKWRSPLVFSPAVKFSPKISFSEKMSKENNDSEEPGNISNETLETSVSSKNSKNTANLTINIQRTPKQPKTTQNIFNKSFKSRGTKFPLCDSEYHESPKNSQSKEFDKSRDYTDICSTPFLEELRIKEHKGSTKKIYKHCEPSTATDYYTQFLNQSVTQKEKHNEKQEYQKHIPSSSASNEDKENIFGNNVPETENQKDFSSLCSIDNSQIIGEQSQNDFESPRNNLTLSQSRPLMFELNLPHCQVNSFRTPDISDLGSGQDYFSMQPRYPANRYCHPSRSQSLPRGEYPMSHHGQYFIEGPTRFLHPAHESQKFRPNETMISADYMESKIPYMPTAPDLRGYAQIRPYCVRSDSLGPDLNQSRYPSVEGMPENYRYPQIPSMRYFHDGDVPFKQDYFNPDMTQHSKLPDFHLRREHSELDAMHNSRLNYSQMERLDQTAVHQDCHFGRKVSFEGSVDDKKTRETKSLSQREDLFPALNASGRHISQERPMISGYDNQENIFCRNQVAQDLNRSFMMRNPYYQPTMDHYIPKNPYPPSGFSNSQNVQFQNRGYLDYPGGGSQPYCVMPRNSDFQQFSMPNDKEYVMNKFLYSLNQ